MVVVNQPIGVYASRACRVEPADERPVVVSLLPPPRVGG